MTTPTSWPATAGLQPFLETTAHSVRFAGPDRYQTNVAANLALRGKGGYPFDSPDPRTGTWGVGTCPRSIIVVAGDTFSDALAAASLSDPTDRSTQPRLTRVAASDPTFDPAGGLDRPDTASAPIVVTRSARQGATGLSPTARATATDLAKGACTLAREAIIVGGASSVPVAVESELVSLGYREVFRVGGADRYDTAARVATALGTGTGTTATACLDSDVTDGSARTGWYGNAVAEFRPDPTTCTLLPRAVVLADGGTGADALAAGWWTSMWQVPLLLTRPDGTLPPTTADALRTLGVDTIVVLGGISRIPETTANEAAALAGGAAVGRVAANDRYATSVAMAERFGGWWPTGNGADFAGDMMCLAASGGDAGWPDALAAGPWCAAANGAASNPGAPARMLPPSDVPLVSKTAPHHRPAHDAVPVLLTPPGSAGLPDAVRLFLQAAFDPAATWCAGGEAAPCSDPGFVVAFGGWSSVSTQAVTRAATAVSGGRYVTPSSDTSPTLASAFVTGLDMAPVFATGSVVGSQLCTPRNAVSGVRWLVGEGPGGSPLWNVDLAARPPFGGDADGKVRGAGGSVPSCSSVPATADLSRVEGFRGVSLSGNVTRSAGQGGGHLGLDRSIAFDQPANASGLPSDLDPTGGGASAWSFARSGITDTTVTSRGHVAALTSVAISLRLERGSEGDTVAPHVITGAITLATNAGTVTGSFTGEGLLRDSTWQMRGAVTWSGGTWNVHAGVGGFAAQLQTSAPGSNADDALVWSSDGLVR